MVVSGDGYGRWHGRPVSSGKGLVAPWQVVVVVLVTAAQGSGSDLHVLLPCEGLLLTTC